MKSFVLAFLLLITSAVAAPYQLTPDWPPGQQEKVIDMETRSLVPRNDPTYLAWISAGNLIKPAPPLDPVHEVEKRRFAGVSVSFTSNPQLNGIYPANQNAQQILHNVVIDIRNGDGLPGGGTTFSFNDTKNVSHEFTADQVIELYKAIRDYSYNVNQATAGPPGRPTTWPSDSVVIDK